MRRGNSNRRSNAFAGRSSCDPADASTYTDLAYALRSLGMLDEAAAAYRQALARDPQFPLAHSNMLVLEHYRPGATAGRAPSPARRVGPAACGGPAHGPARLDERSRPGAGAWSGLRLRRFRPTSGGPAAGRPAGGPRPPVLRDLLLFGIGNCPTRRAAALSGPALAQTLALGDAELAEQIVADRDRRALRPGRSHGPATGCWSSPASRHRCKSPTWATRARPACRPWTTSWPTGTWMPAGGGGVLLRAGAAHAGLLLRLEPPADAPPPNRFPALARGQVTFASFDNPVKITAEVVGVWSRDPPARARGPARAQAPLPSSGSALRRRWEELFEAAGDRGRPGLSWPRLDAAGRNAGRVPGRSTWPWTRSPFKAASPVATPCGWACPWWPCPAVRSPRGMRSRSSRRSGWTEFAGPRREPLRGASPWPWPPILQKLAALRAALRPRMARSPLSDARGFARHLGACCRKPLVPLMRGQEDRPTKNNVRIFRTLAGLRQVHKSR